MAAIGRYGPEPACGCTPDAVAAHQTRHPAPAGGDALRAEGCMHARAAIAAIVATMNASDLDQKLSVGGGPLAFRPPTPRVVTAGGHPEYRAHEPGRELVPVVLDEAEPHLGGSEKMLMAFFKMSRSCRVRSNSRRSRAISAVCSSGLAGMAVPDTAGAPDRERGGCPWATRRQFRSTEAWRPNSRATCSSGRPLPSSRATASRLNSSVKDRLVFVIRHLPAPLGA